MEVLKDFNGKKRKSSNEWEIHFGLAICCHVWQGLWCPGRRDACRFRCLRRTKWHLRWWQQMTPLGSRWSGISGQYVPNFGNRKWRLEPIKLRAQLGCSTCWAGLFQGQMRFLKRRPQRDHRFPSRIWLWTHGLSHSLSHGGRISQHPVAPHRECYGDPTAKNNSWCIVNVHVRSF